MKARLLAKLLGAVTLGGTGVWVFVYLDRWQWNRAILAAILFVATEVALSTLLVTERLRNATPATVPAGDARPARTLARLREAAPDERDHFAWVRRPEQMNVFVPVLMGMGLVLSGLASVAERVARSTATPRLERGLARQLGRIAPPAAGLVPPPGAVEVLRRPVRAGVR